MIHELWLVLGSSLIGSLHCASMCGAFSVMSCGTQNKVIHAALYHLGRLISYMSLTVLVFYLSLPLRNVIDSYHIPLISSVLTLILLGVWLYLLIAKVKVNIKMPRAITQVIRKFRSSSAPLFSVTLGLSTSLLPCFWLYGFVAISATQVSLSRAMLFIFTFWLGTIPSLVLVQGFAVKLNWSSKKYLKPLAVALILLLVSMSTVTRIQALMHSQHETVMQPGHSCHDSKE